MPQEKIKVRIEFKRTMTYRQELTIDKDEYEILKDRNYEDLEEYGETEEAYDIVNSYFDLPEVFEAGGIEDFEIKEITN